MMFTPFEIFAFGVFFIAFLICLLAVALLWADRKKQL
jgi:hypothetical protein